MGHSVRRERKKRWGKTTRFLTIPPKRKVGEMNRGMQKRLLPMQN